MTTPAAAALYLAQHNFAHQSRQPAIHNPHNKPVDQLPVIYGFNNGGRKDWLEGVIIAENGYYLGGHICSDEGYMLADLGILEGTQPDRHEQFRSHYPDGYRMVFVPWSEVHSHAGLSAACERNKALAAAQTES
jgi:hypothetical protein